MLSWEHTEIVEIHKRRYMLKDNALEIFLINGRTLLFAFTSTAVIINNYLALSDAHAITHCHTLILTRSFYLFFRAKYFDFYHLCSRNGIMYVPNSWNLIFPISTTVGRMRMKNSSKSLKGKFIFSSLSVYCDAWKCWEWDLGIGPGHEITGNVLSCWHST